MTVHTSHPPTHLSTHKQHMHPTQHTYWGGVCKQHRVVCTRCTCPNLVPRACLMVLAYALTHGVDPLNRVIYLGHHIASMSANMHGGFVHLLCWSGEVCFLCKLVRPALSLYCAGPCVVCGMSWWLAVARSVRCTQWRCLATQTWNSSIARFADDGTGQLRFLLCTRS